MDVELQTGPTRPSSGSPSRRSGAIPPRPPAGRLRGARPPARTSRPGSPGWTRRSWSATAVLSQLLLGERVLGSPSSGPDGWARVVAVEQPAGRLDPRGYPGWLPAGQLAPGAGRRPGRRPAGRRTPPSPICTTPRTARPSCPASSSAPGCPPPARPATAGARSTCPAARAALGCPRAAGAARPGHPPAARVLAVARRLLRRRLPLGRALAGGHRLLGPGAPGVAPVRGPAAPRRRRPGRRDDPAAAGHGTPRRPLLLRPARPPDPPHRHRLRRAGLPATTGGCCTPATYGGGCWRSRCPPTAPPPWSACTGSDAFRSACPDLSSSAPGGGDGQHRLQGILGD